jgi:tol-pal system protein YbgF
MRIRALKPLLGILPVALLAACATEGDFRAFQAEVRREILQQDQQMRDLRQRVGDLQGERAKGSRQLADHVNELNTLQREVAALQGQMDSLSRKGGVQDTQRSQAELRQELDGLRRAVEQMGGVIPPPGPAPGPSPGPAPGPGPTPPPPTPERAEELYKAAMFRFEGGDNAKAREGFVAVVTRHPDSNLADNAQYWIAESYFREGNFKQSILEFEKVISQYPKSAKVPAALFKQGMAFEKLGDMESARYLYAKVTKDYPDSEQARMADHRLKSIP